MKKNILAIVPALMPSINIGIINPIQYLQQKGNINFKVTLPYLFKSKMLENVDCVIFCRNSMPNEEWILNEVIQKKIPYIYEIDDNFFEIPYDNILGRIHRHPINLSSFVNFIKHASLVRTYSNLLAEDVSFYNQRVEINKVYFDLELIRDLNQNKSSKIKIIYATSRMADSQQDIFNEALKEIAKKYISKVEIYFWGAPIVDKELKTLTNVFHLAPIYNYEKFIKKFYEMGFDIGLAPIFEGKFFNSKTNNKYREYGACKIAGIYSNEDLYNSCVIDENNGLLVENTSEKWYKAIEKLITDDELRNNIISKANSDIEKNYSFEHYCDIWTKSIEKAILNSKINIKSFESYINKDAYIHFTILQDYKMKDEKLIDIKQNLTSNIYVGTSVGILSVSEISIDDMFKANVFLENINNVIILSNDESWIEYFGLYAKKRKINIILLTNLDKSICSKFTNINCMSLLDFDTGVFVNHKDNVYLNIDYMIKKVFKQSKKLPFVERIKYLIKNKIKNNIFTRKILFFIEKKNSIKLRFYTLWKIYKINKIRNKNER